MINILRPYVLYMLVALALTGCSDKEVSDSGTDKEYTINFGIEREDAEIIQQPMLYSKTEAGSLYGVQIYSKTSSSGTYGKYAYGLFDDVSKMEIALPGGSLYRVEISLVINGATTIARDEISSGFRAPFSTMGIGGGNTNIMNEFIVSKSNYMGYIGQGYSSVVVASGGYESFKRPHVDRYHGVVEDFDPSKSGGILAVTLKRVVFGVRFIPDGMSDGNLEISMTYSPTLSITEEHTSIITLDNAKGGNDWLSDSYSEDINVKIEWKRPSVDPKIVLDRKITFCRKNMYTIRLKLDGQTSNGIVIGREDGTLIENEEVVVRY